MMQTSTTIRTLNSLLRGELSAIETYQQALTRIGEGDGGSALRTIHEEHIRAANALRQQVHLYGGEPSQKSGAWGAFAKAIEGMAKILGPNSALKMLETGEKQGLRTYRKALQSPTLPEDCQALIRTTLLPQTQAHIPMLERLIAFH